MTTSHLKMRAEFQLLKHGPYLTDLRQWTMSDVISQLNNHPTVSLVQWSSLRSLSLKFIVKDSEHS